MEDIITPKFQLKPSAAEGDQNETINNETYEMKNETVFGFYKTERKRFIDDDEIIEQVKQ